MNRSLVCFSVPLLFVSFCVASSKPNIQVASGEVVRLNTPASGQN